MKNLEELYQALIHKKELVDKTGRKITLKTSGSCNFDNPEDWEIYDKFSDIKRAYEEGARIELYDTQLEVWVETTDPIWSDNIEYRIKGDITIKRWNKYKNLIKACWDGAIIEYYHKDKKKWMLTLDNEPLWRITTKYRIKDNISLELWDEYKDTIKASWEGAEIEFFFCGKTWETVNDPYWYPYIDYRIKGGISVESWNKWKNIIRAFWDGAKIEVYNEKGSVWVSIYTVPLWLEESEYRIAGGIPIESWEKHKDAIKSFWDGGEIETKNGLYDTWTDIGNPNWYPHIEYKFKTSKCDMESAEWGISHTGTIYKTQKEATENPEVEMKSLSEDQAKIAKEQMKRTNRLRYWVSSIQHLGNGNYFIAFSPYTNQYTPCCNNGFESPSEVYMTKDTAITICDSLNNGDLEF
jgi:hypothetical protein